MDCRKSGVMDFPRFAVSACAFTDSRRIDISNKDVLRCLILFHTVLKCRLFKTLANKQSDIRYNIMCTAPDAPLHVYPGRREEAPTNEYLMECLGYKNNR